MESISELRISTTNLPSRERRDDFMSPPSFSRYKTMYQKSITNPEQFWMQHAEEVLSWDRKPSRISYGDRQNFGYSWFLSGQLNVSYNCIDRHAHINPDKTAIIWEPDAPGATLHISYSQLLAEVSKLANLLHEWGLKKGDKVAIYLPMLPEAMYSMLACARLGLVHIVVFAGFSSDALRDRIVDGDARVLITCDQGFRGGKRFNLKKIADDALVECRCIEKVLVVARTGTEGLPMRHGRDFWYRDVVFRQRPYVDPTPVSSEDPLFILYTSGSTGKPKGLIHTTAGYLLQSAVSLKYIFDVHPNDVFFSTADVGWVTGHSYTTYAPLCLGVTTVLFEGIPTYPNAGRLWRTCQEQRVTQLYTAPTAIRTLKKAGDSFVKTYNLSTLRVLGSVGEPISQDAWMWFYEVVGGKRCALVDTYWQSETGSIVMTTIPGATPMKPASCGMPFFGIEAALVDASTGKEITGNGVSAESAGVGVPDEVTGSACVVFVVLKEGGGEARYAANILEGVKPPTPAQYRQMFIDHVRSHLGPFAAPKHVFIVPDLPKTRSGKVVRRVLRKIASGEVRTEQGDGLKELGDLSTLSEPELVPTLIRIVHPRSAKL
ncbi:acetyl-CoA synthetase [Gonapodya sp. JEL0774]|nr:acetyl-CoA synthetase [Gonapodya sp. JEL0774]